MKKQLILRLCICFVVALCGMPLMAQGIFVYQKDGTKVKFPYERIDSIVAYNYGEDYEAVDLGLSVKWASCNVGAESPEEYGDYFAWGETSPKSIYVENNSTTYNLSLSRLKSLGIIDSDFNLTAAYDAATVNWGGNWRMPTYKEMKELLNKCTLEWTAQNGVNGCKVTGPSGNSIFFPATSLCSLPVHSGEGSNGFYWSATAFEHSGLSHRLYFESGYYDCTITYSRFYGFTVRPVSK